MKILVLGSRSFPAKHGGLEVVVEALCRELNGIGHKVTVVVSDAEEHDNSVEVRVVPHINGKYLHTISQMFSSLRAIDASYDVVHIHGVGPAFILLFRRFMNWSPIFFVTAHGADWKRKKWPKLAKIIFRSVSVEALKRADAISAVSKSTADEITEATGLACYAIGNGLEPALIDGDWKPDLPSKYAVALCRLTPEKNLDMLINSYSPAVAEVHGPLVVIGDGGGSYASDYEQRIKTIPSENVIWMGRLPHDRAMTVLSRARFFINVSSFEAQPMAVLESLALGIPMVLSDIPAHREIAESKAVFVDTNTIEIEKSLLKLKISPDFSNAEKSSLPTWSEVARIYESWFYSVGVSRRPYK